MTIADLLPPKVRDAVYAALVAANGGYVVWAAASDVPLWCHVVIGVVNAGGFSLAKANVQKDV